MPRLQVVPPQQVGLLSDQARRLVWTLQGPITTSISVMSEDLDPDTPRVTYFLQTAAGMGWHPVSQEALADSKPASIKVHSSDLSDWASRWWELHYEHDDQKDEEGWLFYTR